MDENDLLAERLENYRPPASSGAAIAAEGNHPAPSSERSIQDLDLCQWQVSPNGVFRPAARTIERLGAEAYSTGTDNFGEYLKELPLMSDDIISLPETANERVLQSIQKFWTSRDRYEKYGLLFKRGLLLWGPPGSGKTVTIHLLAKDLISKDGIVVFCSHPKETLVLMSIIRKIEPRRPLIVVMEDIDEIINSHGEHIILSLLDGENQTDNVVFLATTNYPERLGERILNRPSRFDERIMIDVPSESARRAYLSAVAELDAATLDHWVAETAGLSVAHLRELVVAVFCLDQDYDIVMKRLRAMMERPKDKEGYARHKMGLT